MNLILKNLKNITDFFETRILDFKIFFVFINFFLA